MSFLIPDAWADTAASAGTAAAGAGAANGYGSLLFMAVLLGVFYLFFIRPQSKRQKEHRNMVQALTKGDEVITSGGLVGKIVNTTDDFIVLEIAEGVEVKIQRMAISSNLPKGSIKAL
jgi:preprotein translocase subunit YajC